MSEELIIEKLMRFGLSRQEAGIYLCLYTNGAMTGYEAAKQTGVSRSNVYTAINGLVEKGAAAVLEGTANKYIALSPEEFTSNYMKYLERLKTDIVKNMPKPVKTKEGYITIEGHRNILDKIQNMLESAEMRVYFSATQDVLLQFAKDFEELIQSGKKLVLLTDAEEELAEKIKDYENSAANRDVKLYTSEKKSAQFRLIIDSEYVLTGQLDGLKTDTALYSAQPNFVEVFKEALSNEIKLIELTGGMKDE